MRIGELAARTGLSRDTLRFYEKRGLLSPDRQNNGYREYSEQAELILGLVARAKALGFTLAEIEADMDAGGGEISAARIETILRAKLNSINNRVSELNRLRAEIEKMLERVCPLSVEAAPRSGRPARRSA